MQLGNWNYTSEISCAKEDDCAYPTLDIVVAETFTHEEYLPGIGATFFLDNDVALIRLSENVTYTDYIRPICLPPRDLEATHFDGRNLVESGWGYNSDGEIIIFFRMFSIYIFH